MKTKSKQEWQIVQKLNSKDRTSMKIILTKIGWDYKTKYNLLEREMQRSSTHGTEKLYVQMFSDLLDNFFTGIRN